MDPENKQKKKKDAISKRQSLAFRQKKRELDINT